MKNCKHKGKILCIKCGYNVAGLTMKEIKEYQNFIGYKKVYTVDLCEVVHTITAEICKAKGVELDRKPIKCKGILDSIIDLRYTAKAQRIFNRYFDLLDNTFRN